MRYYVYFNDDTQEQFVTVYAWKPGHHQRLFCQHIGNSRYTHQDIQLDVDARILTDKRTGSKYALVEPRKPRENLQFETVTMEIVEWQN